MKIAYVLGIKLTATVKTIVDNLGALVDMCVDNLPHLSTKLIGFLYFIHNFVFLSTFA